MPRTLWMGTIGLGVVFAVACGTGSPSGAGGSCPCAVGNSGLQFTIPCGGSDCVTLNGTATGYRCESDGTHVDPAVCEGPQAEGGVSDSQSPVETGGGESITVVCDESTSGSFECSVTILHDSDASSLDFQCTDFGGKLASACPTANVLGCCSYKAGYDYELCYYSPKPDVTALESECKSNGGTWSTSL
jgi:hypothetical protein